MCTTSQGAQIEVLLPEALDPAALELILRLHVESVLARTGLRLVTFDHGPGRSSSPGVTCWPVTYYSVADEAAAS
ncbi:hypothetical protein [Nocardia asteroides]